MTGQPHFEYPRTHINLHQGRGGDRFQAHLSSAMRGGVLASQQVDGPAEIAEHIIKGAVWLDVLSKAAAQAGCSALTMEGIIGVQMRFFASSYNALQRLDGHYGAQWEHRW